MVRTAQGFGQKPLSRCCIAFSLEIVAPADCTARYKYTHLPFIPHVRLVRPPRVVRRLEAPARAPLQFRSIPLDPSPDGDVNHREPTVGQKLLRRHATKARSANTSRSPGG
jgi:hypothetical protein